MSCSVRETQWSSSSLRATRINRVSPARAAAVPTSSTKRRWRCASSAQRSDCIGAGLHPRQSRPVRQLPGVGLTAEESFSCTALSSKVASAGVLIVRMNPSVRCDFSLLRQLDLDRRRKSPGFLLGLQSTCRAGPPQLWHQHPSIAVLQNVTARRLTTAQFSSRNKGVSRALARPGGAGDRWRPVWWQPRRSRATDKQSRHRQQPLTSRHSWREPVLRGGHG